MREQNSPNHAIAFLKAVHPEANLMDDAGGVTAQDGGPLLDEDAGILHVAVKWINGDRGGLDDKLASASLGKRGVADLERCVWLLQPC